MTNLKIDMVCQVRCDVRPEPLLHLANSKGTTNKYRLTGGGKNALDRGFAMSSDKKWRITLPLQISRRVLPR
jgi:hypothetical protein